MADDEITAERKRLLGEVEVFNNLLANIGVPTRLPMSVAETSTVAELRLDVPALRRFYLEKHRLLGGNGG